MISEYECKKALQEIYFHGKHDVDQYILLKNLIENHFKNGTYDNHKQQKDTWILSKDKMPKDLEYVLVFFEYFRYGDYNSMYKTYGISYAIKGEWSGFVNGSSGYDNLKIIAWMPLPEPYKKVEE